MKKRTKKKIYKLIVTFIVFLVASFFGFYSNMDMPKTQIQTVNLKEKDYVRQYCKGQIEFVLEDKTRVDCLTDDYAIEFDWAYKWAESIGQSLYYAKKTGKNPAVALILKSPDDEKYVKRVEAIDKDIKIFKIEGYK